MNKFEPIIRRHWQTFLPNGWSQLADPDRMVRESAIELEREVQSLAESIAGPSPAGETYMERVARLMSARRDAESDLVRELLPAPEEHLEAVEAEDLQRELAELAAARERRLEMLREQAEEEAFQREDLTAEQQTEEVERILAFLLKQDAMRAAHQETLARQR